MNDNPVLTESTYYILLSLYTPQHGYGIMQRTEALSGGRVRLAAGTIKKSPTGSMTAQRCSVSSQRR